MLTLSGARVPGERRQGRWRRWARWACLVLLCLGLARTAAADPVLPPLPAGPGYARLPVPGYLPAVVAWPEAAAGAVPIAVAAHGSFDQPEWNCETFSQVVRGAAVVLCPRGKLRWDSPSEPAMLRFYFPATSGGPAKSSWLQREVDAALRALQGSAAARLAPGPVLYIGFSQGAILGAPLLIQAPARFPRAILVEGGHGAWNPSTARTFARGGGQRILFACGRESCLTSARAAAAHLTAAGVATQVVYAPDQGHTYDGQVKEQIAAAFAWVTAGDARFAGPLAAPAAPAVPR